MRNPIAGVILAAVALSGCDDIQNIPLFQKKDQTGAAQPAAAAVGETIERDVEAPDVFEATEAGLWDGRPSLGGVWVAHPDATDPERVVIRNEANGKSVIGALFRRERENPGPRLQVSSDAASALDLLAGAPTRLHVVALRTETVTIEPEISPGETADAAPTEGLEAPAEIETQALDPIASAAAAIDAAESGASEPVITPAADSTPAPAPVVEAAPAGLPVSALEKPYVQIGIFSVEDNASRTAQSLRAAGVNTLVKAQESQGKKFWRVVAGPASTEAERRSLRDQVLKLGYEDAYFVTN